MARVLVLTPQLPYPPQQGTSLRNYHLLRALAQRHDVSLLSFAESDRPQDIEPLRMLGRVIPPIDVPARSGADRLKQLLTSTEPDLALRLRSDAFAAALAEALRAGAYDVVQIEGLELAYYIHTIRAVAPGVKIVLDCHNAETELQRRSLQADLSKPARWPAAVYSAMQVGRLVRFERWAVTAADAVIAVSETDRDHLIALGSVESESIAVIPNTIDVSEYDDPAPVPNELRFDLVFTGKMDYRPNIDGVLWFANDIWPLIQRARPETTWAIVGQRPHPRLEPLRELDGVTLTGRVPEIRPYLKGCRVYIIPLRIGSGTRLKLIEAMAAGVAVVSTSIGAEGFPLTDGENVILADDPSVWSRAVLALLNDEARRERLGAAARTFATRYDWRGIVSELDALMSGITQSEKD